MSKMIAKNRSFGHVPTKEVKTFFKNLDNNYSLLTKESEIKIFDEIKQLKDQLICNIIFSKIASKSLLSLIDKQCFMDHGDDEDIENDKKELIDSFKLLKEDLLEIELFFSTKKGKKGSIKDESYVLEKLSKHTIPFDMVNNLINQVKTNPEMESRFLSNIVKIETQLNDKKNIIVGSNVKLVAKHCQKIKNDDMDYFDLMNEGILGIISAIEKFDNSKGIKFSTYATFWIRHHVGRSVQNKTKTIRIPVHIQELSYKIIRKEKELLARHRTISLEVLAKELNVSVKKIKMAKEAHLTIMSMSNSIDDDTDNSTTFESQIAASNVYNVEESTIAHDFTNTIDTTLMELKKISLTLPKDDQISDIDIYILKHRKGLTGADPISLEEAGIKLKLTKERVRQLEHKLEKKCKHKVIQEHMKKILMVG